MIPSERSYNRARYYDPNAGRFISEDPLGLRHNVNMYVYVKNNSLNFEDPLGLYELKGFPEVGEVLMRLAIKQALETLRDSCRNCAGKDGAKLADIIENATFVYVPNSKNCGQTGPVSFLGLRHTFGIGPAGLGPSCCSLASTIVHEAVHGMRHSSDKRPDQVEKDCFACTAPE
jgi:hypothetical protein